MFTCMPEKPTNDSANESKQLAVWNPLFLSIQPTRLAFNQKNFV